MFLTKAQMTARIKKEMIKRFRISEEDAELVKSHPNPGHVVAYAQFCRISIREAMNSGHMWKVTDPTAEADGSEYGLAWAVTAHEAWAQVRSSISTRPPFYRCVFEPMS